MTTARELITNALRLFSIVDQTEDPTASDIANGVKILNDLLRSEQSDGACQYLMRRVNATLPAGVQGSIYTFSIGVAQTSYLVQQDAVAVKALYMNDLNITVNRETRMGPIADVVRTTYPGIITKWHQERQTDGSVLITAWQPPRAASRCLIEFGARMPIISAVDGSDTVALPPEGIHDATLLFGRRVAASYGRVLSPADVIVQDAERVHRSWRDWARGQQWLRMVRN